MQTVVRLDLDLVFFCYGKGSEPCDVCHGVGPVRCLMCRRSIGCQMWPYVPLLCPACSVNEFGEAHAQRAWSAPRYADVVAHFAGASR